jgi:DNA-binding beta-propeller fold protein YncE
MGNVYVADTGNNRIQFFLAGQLNGTTIAGTGSAGFTSDMLHGPYFVKLDNQLNVYVADYYNYRVQEFVRY